jgi:hypothetical protein
MEATPPPVLQYVGKSWAEFCRRMGDVVKVYIITGKLPEDGAAIELPDTLTTKTGPKKPKDVRSLKRKRGPTSYNIFIRCSGHPYTI